MDHLNNWSCTDIFDEHGGWQDYITGYDPKISDPSVIELEGTSDLMWNLGGILPDSGCNVNPFASSLLHCGELSPGLSTARFSQARPLDYSHGLDGNTNTSTPDSIDGSPWSPSQEYATSKKERRRAQNRKAQQAFRDRKDRAILLLEKEVQRLRGINQNLATSNQACEVQISKLKSRIDSIESTRLSVTSPSSLSSLDMPSELDRLNSEWGDDNSCGASPTLRRPTLSPAMSAEFVEKVASLRSWYNPTNTPMEPGAGDQEHVCMR